MECKQSNDLWPWIHSSVPRNGDQEDTMATKFVSSSILLVILHTTSLYQDPTLMYQETTTTVTTTI